MTQLKDDCFAFGGKLMSVAEALALVDQRVTAVAGRETLTLRAAHRRFLAEDLTSAMDVPPFTNAAVDGYAFASADLKPAAPTRLRIRGRATAGHQSYLKRGWTSTARPSTRMPAQSRATLSRQAFPPLTA